MNTIAIVEEWDQFQDEGLIDGIGFPEHQAVEFTARPVGLCEEYAHRYEHPSGAAARRFGFPAYSSGLEDDDPE